jgi:DNA-binding MarR family transcriptional regulator
MYGKGGRGYRSRNSAGTLRSTPKRLTADELWEAMQAGHLAFHAELSRILERHGMIVSEFRALCILSRGPATLSILAAKLGLTPATLTDIARDLEQRGWTRRTTKRSDRRAQILTITASGRRDLKSAQKEKIALIKRVENAMTPISRDALAGALQDMLRAIGELHERGGR